MKELVTFDVLQDAEGGRRDSHTSMGFLGLILLLQALTCTTVSETGEQYLTYYWPLKPLAMSLQ